MGLLETLSSALADGRTADLYVVSAKLESLRHRIAELSPAAQRRLETTSRSLRQPLLSLLERCLKPEPLGAAARRDLRTILSCLRCMTDRLDHPELGPRLAVRYARTDITLLARSACAAFATIADERDLAFGLDIPERLQAELDPDKFQAVLVNLLLNAFKHTPAGSEIRCGLRADEAEDELILSVTDGGPSLPPARVEAILHAPEERGGQIAHGLGLSLASSRDLLLLHGGTLALRNNDDAGVTFEARLPRSAPQSSAVARKVKLVDDFAARVVELARKEVRAETDLGVTAVVVNDGRPLILIVEDTRSLHRLLAECFKAEYRVVSAFDGLEGLAKAEALQPDLILTDLMMPRLDGPAMIREIRQRPALRSTPIVVLTTKESPEQELELLESKVQDVIHKPFLVPEVRARVRNLIASKRARDVLGELVDRHQTDLIHLADTVARQQRELRAALDHVETARDVADGANRVKSNFLRMMSHELRTPVTALQLQLRLLQRDPLCSDNPKLKEGLDRVWRSSNRLVHLVDTMLEWARVESHRCQLELAAFDLEAVLAEIGGELSSHAQQKGVALEIDCAKAVGPLTSDRRLVQLILVNLVARAVQLTDSGKVSVGVSRHDGLHRVSVRDLAPQVGAHQREELFEAVQSARDPQGPASGLGLFVLRDIARAISGEIVLEPNSGQGNVLTLELPCLPLAPTAVPSETDGK